MPRGIVSVPPYQPSNVYRPMDRLPDPFHRVLLLPLALRTSETTDPSAFETLQPVLAAELRKRNAFEVITFNREQLRQWTGRDSWADSNELPANLLQQLQKTHRLRRVALCRTHSSSILSTPGYWVESTTGPMQGFCHCLVHR